MGQSKSSISNTFFNTPFLGQNGSINNLDLGVHKLIALRESTNLEFRAETFNVFNHTQFFNPDGNITDGSSFGQVSRAQDPRLVQVALRLSF